MRPPSWRDEAACDGTPEIDLLFERDRMSEGREKFCAVCPVKEICGDTAIDPTSFDYNITHGLRGGLTPRQRKARIKREVQGVRARVALKLSPYQGVSWSKTRQCWRAQLSIKRKSFHLGYFPDTPEGQMAAARAYDRAIQHYRLDRELNFLSEELDFSA